MQRNNMQTFLSTTKLNCGHSPLTDKSITRGDKEFAATIIKFKPVCFTSLNLWFLFISITCLHDIALYLQDILPLIIVSNWVTLLCAEKTFFFSPHPWFYAHNSTCSLCSLEQIWWHRTSFLRK